METAAITLQGSLSHTFKLPGKPEIKLIKGHLLSTTDPEVIQYARSRPVDFAISITRSEPKIAPEVEMPVEASSRVMTRSPVRRKVEQTPPSDDNV
jgi:hypothetical protein